MLIIVDKLKYGSICGFNQQCQTKSGLKCEKNYCKYEKSTPEILLITIYKYTNKLKVAPILNITTVHFVVSVWQKLRFLNYIDFLPVY